MGNQTNIKIIRLPSFFKKRQFSSKANCSLIPPLGLGLISAYLRSQGLPLEQDDLNIKIAHDNHYCESGGNSIDTEVFFDEPRIARYAGGISDYYLDSVMDKVISKISISHNQIMLLSLPDNIENNSNLLFTLAFSRFIKERFGTINILGGESMWIDLLKNKYASRYIDHIIYGEGESPLHYLLNSILHREALSSSRDMDILDEGKAIMSYKNLKPIKPDFSGLPMEKYRSRDEILEYPDEIDEIMKRFQDSRTLILPYRFIKGCPFECIFCVSSTKDISHALPPEEIASHLKSLQDEYNPTGFFFLNDTINISKSYINKLCDEIISNKIKVLWSDCARVDNLDEETIFKMRKAGCIRLIFGVESASPRLLKYINKKIELSQLENVLRWSDNAGIWTGLEIICGLPHENKEDIESTVSFLRANYQYVNRIYLNHFDLRENTPLYNFPGKYGIRRIFEVNQYAKNDFISYVRFGFDEVDGLSWNEKERQIEESLKTVQQRCVQGYRYFTDEHLLFFLYSNLTNKKEINSIYLKIIKRESIS